VNAARTFPGTGSGRPWHACDRNVAIVSAEGGATVFSDDFIGLLMAKRSVVLAAAFAATVGADEA
jgi:hypothetical protein